jgi:hypothetical protein
MHFVSSSVITDSTSIISHGAASFNNNRERVRGGTDCVENHQDARVTVRFSAPGRLPSISGWNICP